MKNEHQEKTKKTCLIDYNYKNKRKQKIIFTEKKLNATIYIYIYIS